MLRFPDLDTLRLALHRQAVPLDVRRAGAVAGFDEQGSLWLEPASPLRDEVLFDLQLLGVDIDAAGSPPPTEPICSWHQLLGLVPVRADDALPSVDTPVLFELADREAWPKLVSEIRRLAPHHRSVAWRETDDGRLLVRVVGPPLFSLLGALERDSVREGEAPAEPKSAEENVPACAADGVGQGLEYHTGRQPDGPSTARQEPRPPVLVETSPRLCRKRVAYIEQLPRVWVELGWRHPVAADISLPTGQSLLIRRPRAWSFIADGRFESELAELPLPEVQPRAADTPTSYRLHVPLRLTRCTSNEPAELWVIRERPFEQLAELLRIADDAMLAPLAIAAMEKAGNPVIVLRTRIGKHAPPVLVLQAESYRSYLKLPNLFLPVGKRLHPPLRRDAVRELLAGDACQATWLAPQESGTFVPERIPDAMFAPLLDLVEYVQEHHTRPLKPWAQSASFDLEPFLPHDEDVPANFREQVRKLVVPIPDDEPAPRGGILGRIGRWFRNAVAGLAALRETQAREDQTQAEVKPADPVATAVHKFLQPTVVSRQARTPPPVAPPAGDRSVEDRFLRIAGPLDAPERVALWPKLAGFYQAEKKWGDAAVCWMNGLWEAKSPSPLWLWGWFHSEAQAAQWNEEQPTEDIDRCLLAGSPDVADVRTVAAYTVWAIHQQTPPPELVNRLGRISHYLQANEHFLPVRAAWLAWAGLSQLAGGDLLTLARARDRLLERLFRTGVNLDMDLPGFLRYAGQGGTVRSEPIRDWLVWQRNAIHRWINGLHENQPPDPELQDRNKLATARLQGKHPPYGPAGEAYCTCAYADLTLAWGLARLGAVSEATQMWKQARAILATRDEVHRFLLESYSHRIEQILEGRSADGPLPDELLGQLLQMPDTKRYKIDWLRQQSRILEPDERIDPYRGDVQREYFDSLNPALARLPDIVDRNELKRRIEQLLTTAPDTAEFALPRILKAALAQAPRIDESFAQELLGRVSAALEEIPAAVEAAPLLEKALFVAAHFEQTVYVQQFLARFQHLLDRRHGPQAARAFASLAEQSFRGLRKLGMRDEIDRLLKQMADNILQGQSLPNLRVRMGVNIAGVLPTLLHGASVWFYEGNDADAIAVLDQVSDLLFSNRLPPTDQASLAKAYATSLGQAPPAVALDRLEELFQHLEHVHDALTTGSHFSLSQLGVIEAAVRSVVDANFTLGATVRRWLDEDEYLMRRRIHQDLKAVMA